MFFFSFSFYRFFSQQVRGGGRNKNENKIHSDYFPIEFKIVFPSILIQLENSRNEFYFHFHRFFSQQVRCEDKIKMKKKIIQTIFQLN